MLSNVADDVDKQEGSIIYDAISLMAPELAQAYISLDRILELTFARTSEGEFLEYRTEESGVKRERAIKAVRKGVFNIDIPIGSRFQGGEVIYSAIERLDVGVYKMEAETAGEIGNKYFGNLLPLDNIDGLTSAILSDVLVEGVDEETDEQLYDRYSEEINTIKYGGNVSQYKEWINEIPGVGRVKVFPLWQGRGTVKATILDVNNQVPSQELIDLVQNTLDPYQDGKGNGLVPIGHVFTAVGGIAKVVNINLEVVFNDGYGPVDIQEEVEQIINQYFSEINFLESTIRHAIIISRVVTALKQQVKDVLNLELNGVGGNLILGEEEVATLGTVNIIEN